MESWGWIAGAIGAALLVALAVTVVRGQRRMRALEERLARAERTVEVAPDRAPVPVVTQDDDDDGEALVPTPLGPREDDGPVTRVDREIFWDLFLRESVVRVAAVGHGVRAVLDPRTRNRIRFEVKQQIKSARKQRRSEERAAVRQLRQDRLEDAS